MVIIKKNVFVKRKTKKLQEYVDGRILTQFEVEDYHNCAVR